MQILINDGSGAYSNVLMDKIEETVKNGLVGNETEDW